MLTTSLVPTEQVPTVWREVASMLQKALDTTPGFYDIPSLFEAVLSERQRLWIIFEDNGEDEQAPIIAAFTTMIVVYPLANTLAVPFMGGDRMEEWFWEAYEIVKRFAFDHSCSGVEAYGRKGWGRWLGDDWKPIHSYLKVLE